MKPILTELARDMVRPLRCIH